MTNNSNEQKAAALARLTDTQRKVTQNGETERAFENEYWNHNEAGIYVDIVSAEPLFASVHKYETDCGWPSFLKALARENIREVVDRGHGMIRTEVRSREADSHLGHVFPDGPEPTGLRYCINSAALRFVPQDELEGQGFGDYLGLFESDDESQSGRP